MSRISDEIRSYVNDPDVADHYGSWGILRKDQRRKIRELCDTCDMFEKTADEAMKQVKGFWISVEDRLPTKQENKRGLVGIVNGRNGTIRFVNAIVLVDYDFDEKEWLSPDYDLTNCKVEYWMPLPKAPKRKNCNEAGNRFE